MASTAETPRDRDARPRTTLGPLLRVENLRTTFQTREDFDAKYPEALAALNAFMPLLDGATMCRLNAEVDVDGKAPRDVAVEWLRASGFQK